MYTDVCILNQTTLQLDYHLKDDTRNPILPPKPEATTPGGDPGGGGGGGGGGGEAAGSANTALSLLCTRSDPSQAMPELRLKVRGVKHVMCANQRFESEDGKPVTDLALCEPHERMLNGTFLHTL